MKKSLLIALVLCVFSAYAQQEQKKEFIVTPANDTLYGDVLIKSKNRTFSEVSFRENSQSDYKLYVPQTVKAFYDNAWGSYVSQEVTIDPGKENMSKFNSVIHDKVFLETLLAGQVDLYYLRNSEYGQQFFLVKGDSVIQLLQYSYTKYVDGRRALIKEKPYLNTLNYYLSDCKEIYPVLTRTALKSKDLTNLLTHYHGCMNKPIEYQKPLDQGKWNFGIVAGVAIIDLSFSEGGKSSLAIAGEDFSTSTSFIAGISGEYFLSKRNPKLSLLNQLMLTKVKSSADFDDLQWNPNLGMFDSYASHQFDFDFLFAKLINQVKYRFSLKKFSPFITGGIGSSIILNDKSRGIAERNNVEGEYDYKEFMRKYQPGFTAGAGLSFGRLDFQVQYELALGVTEPTDHSSSTTKSVYGLITYNLVR